MKYFYSHDGTHRQGPVTLDELRRTRLFPTTIIWHDGLGEWAPAPKVPELADLFHPAGQPTPSSVPPPMTSTATSSATSPAMPIHPYSAPSIRPIVQSVNGLGIASMVLGIVSLVLSPCLWFLSVIPAVLAIVFGHVARRQIRWGNGGGPGFAVAGLILGYLAVALSVASLMFFLTAFSSPRATPILPPTSTPTPAPGADWDAVFNSGNANPPVSSPVPMPLPSGRPATLPARKPIQIPPRPTVPPAVPPTSPVPEH